MNIELRHLRSIMAIHNAGSLQAAATQLHVTQSALSHQIKGIQDQIGVDLFIKNVKPMRLSPEGMRFLHAAEKILPEIEALKAKFTDLQDGKAGRLHIAIECHACFEWLFPVINMFREDFPDIDIDIRPGFAFRALPALHEGEIDVVISSDPEMNSNIEFHELFSYAPTFVAAKRNPLAKKRFIEAADFADQMLITYPVERTRLDIFSQLLIPAKVEPKAIRQVELTAIILLLVDANKGVSVLPDWVITSAEMSKSTVTKPITKQGLRRKLYAATRKSDNDKAFIQRFIELSREGKTIITPKQNTYTAHTTRG